MARDVERLSAIAARGVSWRFAASLLDALAQFAASVVLARLLQPSDFGLMSLSFVVLGIAAGLHDLGIPAAVVHRDGLTERHVRTAFTVIVALRVGIALVVFVSAPLAATAMDEPRIIPVLRWLSLSLAVQGWSVVAGALLRRNLDFRRQFLINVSSYVIGYVAVAVALSLLGYGVWSLVWGSLAQSVVSAAGHWVALRHPKRLLVARRELRELLHYGIGTASSAWMNYAARNGDNLIVGRALGIESLGLYTRAYALMNLPFTYGIGVLTSVLFPAMSRLQFDRNRLQRAYILMTALAASATAPAMATIGVAAPHLVATLYGARWTGSIAPLQILCAFGYFRTLYHVGGIVVQSAGRVYGELRNQVAYAVLVLLGALVGSWLGLSGVAMGVGVAIFGMFVLTTRLALSATGASWQRCVSGQVTAVVAGIVSLAICLVVRNTLERYGVGSPLVAGAVLLCGGIATGGAVLWVLGRREFDDLRAQLPRFAERLAIMLQMARRRGSASERTARL